MSLRIVKVGINGEGIGYYHKKPVFVMGCWPDEVVEVLLEDRGKYYQGKLQKIYQASPYRIKPISEDEYLYGGCSLMSLNYEQQLIYKKQILEEALLKYAHYSGKVEDVVASDEITGYRNKCSLPIVSYKGKLVNAMYASSSNHPHTIVHFATHDKQVEQVRVDVLKVLNEFKAMAYDNKSKKGFRYLMVRGFGKGCQVVLVTGEEKIDDLLVTRLMAIDNVVSIYQGINTQKNPVHVMPDKLNLLSGQANIDLEVASYHFHVAPQSFFQLNLKQGEKIYHLASELVASCDHVVEAYCGIGAISLCLSAKANKVSGIDINKQAIKNAKMAAKENGITNAQFYAGDATSKLQEIAQKEPIDALVVDPPRSGLDHKFIEVVNKLPIKKIVYISCNPATLAKNIEELRDFKVEKVTPFDMFPQTPLVETVVLLERDM